MFDINKILEKLSQDESINNVSVLDVISVTIAVLTAINSGECYKDSQNN